MTLLTILWGLVLGRAGRCDEELLLWVDCAGLCKVSFCFICLRVLI